MIGHSRDIFYGDTDYRMALIDFDDSPFGQHIELVYTFAILMAELYAGQDRFPGIVFHEIEKLRLLEESQDCQYDYDADDMRQYEDTAYKFLEWDNKRRCDEANNR